MGSTTADEGVEELKGVWQQSALTEMVQDPNTQWLLGGVNVRVNALQALKAIYLSAMFYLKGQLALGGGSIGPEEIASLGKNLFDVVVTTLDALRERLRTSTYIACVVLAGSEVGLTPAELASEMRAFLQNADPKKLPFYMGMTDSFLGDARKEMSSPGATDVVLQDLRRGKWVVESEDGRLVFRERNFVWGVSEFT